jgi:regulatory protein
MNNKLLNYYLWLLGKRDYSEFSLKNKALEKSYEVADIEECLISLKAKNFVNDERYTQTLVQKYKTTKGLFWMQNKLKSVGISKEIMSANLQNFSVNKEGLSDLKVKLGKKYRVENWAKIDPKLKQKIIGWLSRNGHASVFEILSKWEREEQD